VTLTLTTDDTPLPYQPDAQIRGGLDSAYRGNGICNQDGLGQTFQRQVRPGFGDQFNIRIQNDGDCQDSFFVHGAGSSSKFQITYWSGSTNVTAAVVAGTYQTPVLNAGDSANLLAFIHVRRTTKIGSWMTDRISVTSDTDPAVSDVVGAKVLVSRNAGDLNSSRPIL